MNGRVRVLRIAGLIASLVAVFLSGALLRLHAVGTSDLGFLAGICGGEGEGCSKVIASRWGVFPPGPPAAEGATQKESESTKSKASAASADGTPAGDAAAAAHAKDAGAAERHGEERSGIPVAALGLFYFSLLAIWFAVVGRAQGRARWLQHVFRVGCIAGAAFSLTYLIIMYAAVGTTCPLCLGSHVANFGILAIALFLPPGPADAPANPDLRLGVVALALAITACTAEWESYRALRGDLQATQIADLRTRLAELSTIEDDAERLEALHLSLPKEKLNVRDDDPRIPATGPHMQLVFFGDIECPNCARFYDFLKAKLLPLFHGHLEVIYKHYPIQRHTHAIQGERALEAARLQGKFWPMYDYLHARREHLGEVNYAAAAREVGLDPDRFIRDMGSSEASRRIYDDVHTAQGAGVKGTPSVFLNDRSVERLFRTNMGFWKLRADKLKRFYETRDKTW